MGFQQFFEPGRVNEFVVREGIDAAGVLALLEEHDVRYLRLQFMDLFGEVKSFEVAASQFGRAVAGELMFDGSSVDGRARVEESDMYLRPDPATLCLLPWTGTDSRVASLVCDLHRPDGAPFEGDPRGALRRAVQALNEEGFEPTIGAEVEFFLFRMDAAGEPTLRPQDRGGYYDVAPLDAGESIRRDIVGVLEAMGFGVASSHHEVAPGQHKVDLLPTGALALADALASLSVVVKMVAARHGVHATFMPKPNPDQNGSGLHTHHALLRDGENAFFDPEARDDLADVLRLYVGGLLAHARGYCAITNPLVNSYKRLVPGYQAPVNVAWSLHTRSHMVRIPVTRGPDTRCEVRIADPAANPYLALAVQLAAGLDGLRQETHPGDPINKSLWALSQRERQRLRIPELPRHLGEALDELERDRTVRAALGEYIYSHYTTAKRAEFEEYLAQVHPWEVQRYF